MNYIHLTREERYQIYTLKKAGYKQYEIAEVLERSESTICRELARNRGGRSYRPKQAHCMSEKRPAMNARRIDDATWQFACARLQEQLSPDQISQPAEIGIETVYQRVYADKREGDLLWKHLRCLNRPRFTRHFSVSSNYWFGKVGCPCHIRRMIGDCHPAAMAEYKSIPVQDKYPVLKNQYADSPSP